MTITTSISESFYPKDWLEPLYSTSHSFLVPLEVHSNPDAKSIRTLFAPSAGALYVYRPSRRRRALNKAVDKLEATRLPGFEYVISYLYDKYRRNHSVSSISQTGGTLHAFLSFYKELGGKHIEDIQRSDIAGYVEHEQDRKLKINSVRNHLHSVYAFLRYLTDHEVLPLDILHKKIKLKMPEVLPRAIPTEDLQRILSVITKVRDRAFILLLLHTGMRIGELLSLKLVDIIFHERKILLYIGEKNLHGRTVYYNSAAEEALLDWLRIRNKNSDHLFYGNTGGELSYVGGWNIMKMALEKCGLKHKGYSPHSLRHTFATNMLNAGMRLEVLQQLLGHLTIDITLRYAKISNVTREDAYFEAMAIIEKGGRHEHDRVNPELQAVFEEKKLLDFDS
ncbi:tyrosine-type recombinase/integrase [Desulforhopalus sp. 52FAK]